MIKVESYLRQKATKPEIKSLRKSTCAQLLNPMMSCSKTTPWVTWTFLINGECRISRRGPFRWRN